jgi:hypothetical protein
VKNDSIAILFDQLGPYHWARLQAAARLFRTVAIAGRALDEARPTRHRTMLPGRMRARCVYLFPLIFSHERTGFAAKAAPIRRTNLFSSLSVKALIHR